MRVTAVVVNYNTRDLLLENLRLLCEARDTGALDAVIVVDSASSDGSADVAQAVPGVQVLRVPNRGFGAGCNRGIQAALDAMQGDLHKAACLILNADAHMGTTDIRALVDVLQQHPDTGLAGPLLRYPNGDLQPSLRRFPTRLTPLFESTPLAWRWPHNRWRSAYLCFDRSGDISKAIADAELGRTSTLDADWLVGAALFLRAQAIVDVGGFDERFDMFSEEVDLAWRLRECGWRARWTAAATAIHVEGASTTQDLPRRLAQFDTSRVRLTRDHFGSPTAEIVRIGLLLGYVWSLAVEGGKFLLGHRRDLRRARLGLYAAALRSGLRDRAAQRAPLTPVRAPRRAVGDA